MFSRSASCPQPAATERLGYAPLDAEDMCMQVFLFVSKNYPHEELMKSRAERKGGPNRA